MEIRTIVRFDELSFCVNVILSSVRAWCLYLHRLDNLFLR